jgi:thioredoxin-related protein
MSRTVGLLCVVIAVILPPSVGMSQQVIRWEPTFEGAQRLASQTNRLVLIYFSGPACPYCRQMEAETLSQPLVAAAVNADYVAVKVVADHFPSTARRYGVTKLPTTVITTPEGVMVDSKPEFVRADEYIARISQVAAEVKRRRIAAAQIAGGAPAFSSSQPGSNQPPVNQYPGNPPAMVQTPAPGQASFGPMGTGGVPPTANAPVSNMPAMNPMAMPQNVPQGPSVSVGPPSYGVPGSAGVAPNNVPPPGVPTGIYGQSQRPIAAPPTRVEQPPAAPVGPDYGSQVPPPVAAQQPVMPPVAAQQAVMPPQNSVMPAIAPGNPPLGLDGFCPVTLAERQRWVRGDPRWGAKHRERLYLFAGPEEQRRFFADPDRYAPVASGNDIVLASEQGQAVSGTREHGVFFGNRVYLFSSEASLEKFSRNPGIYANQALEAVRGSANNPRYQWR